MNLKYGTPQVPSYKNLLQSDFFEKIETFSNNFIKLNSKILGKYSQKWVTDPLHQWSRQWEYPFVYQEILKLRKRRKGTLKILDAGSGITFFPYLASKTIPGTKIECIDSDSDLIETFKRVNKKTGRNIKFVKSDIHKLPYKDDDVDAIYCISVLEHTKDYEQIIREFRRVIKPGGIFIVTFDISIDGNSDIPPSKAKQLLRTLNRYFPNSEKNWVELISRYKSEAIINTKYINKYNKRLLPWRFPLLSNLKLIIKLKLPKGRIKNLTFFCYVFR